MFLPLFISLMIAIYLALPVALVIAILTGDLSHVKSEGVVVVSFVISTGIGVFVWFRIHYHNLWGLKKNPKAKSRGREDINRNKTLYEIYRDLDSMQYIQSIARDFVTVRAFSRRHGLPGYEEFMKISNSIIIDHELVKEELVKPTPYFGMLLATLEAMQKDAVVWKRCLKDLLPYLNEPTLSCARNSIETISYFQQLLNGFTDIADKRDPDYKYRKMEKDPDIYLTFSSDSETYNLQDLSEEIITNNMDEWFNDIKGNWVTTIWDKKLRRNIGIGHRHSDPAEKFFMEMNIFPDRACNQAPEEYPSKMRCDKEIATRAAIAFMKRFKSCRNYFNLEKPVQDILLANASDLNFRKRPPKAKITRKRELRIKKQIPSIIFNCHHCLQSLDAEEDLWGERLTCPTCNKPITVPIMQPESLEEPIQESKKN